MTDKDQTRLACETLATSIAAVLEDNLEYAVRKPNAGLRGYAAAAAALQRAGQTVTILASAMATLAKGAGGARDA